MRKLISMLALTGFVLSVALTASGAAQATRAPSPTPWLMCDGPTCNEATFCAVKKKTTYFPKTECTFSVYPTDGCDNNANMKCYHVDAHASSPCEGDIITSQDYNANVCGAE